MKRQTALTNSTNTTDALSESKTAKRAKKNAATTKEAESTLDNQDAEYFETIIEAPANTESDSKASGQNAGGAVLFSQLSLSRSLLRGVERAGYVSATPIQAQVIPYALAGKDICASAETGSGKTAGTTHTLALNIKSQSTAVFGGVVFLILLSFWEYY